MSVDNVTPIGGKTNGRPPPPTPELAIGLALAIQEQQDRVWRLRSLLETLCTAVMDGDSVEDEEAAIRGLIEYADGVHDALDLDALKKRAAKIAEDSAAAEARGKQS